MSMLTRIIISVTAALLPFTTSATERKGKAVYEISKEQGMKLTAPALKNIEVVTAKVSGSPKLNIPKEALVHFQDQVGVYRLKEGWFKLVQISELQLGDEIAIHGADLLRVSEMDAFESGE